MRGLSIAIFAVFFAASVSSAAITIDGSGYPPPGGATFSSSGSNIGTAGGKTFTFTDIDLSQTAELYWGMDYLASSVLGVSMDGPGISGDELFGATIPAFSIGASGRAWFSGTQVVDLHNGTPETHDVGVIFYILITGDGEWIEDATTVALDGPNAKPHALWHVTGTSFSANIVAAAQNPHTGDFVPYNDLFNSLQTLPGASTAGNFGARFYWENAEVNASVPEPATLTVWSVLGLASLGAVYWRRRSRRDAIGS